MIHIKNKSEKKLKININALNEDLRYQRDFLNYLSIYNQISFEESQKLIKLVERLEEFNNKIAKKNGSVFELSNNGTNQISESDFYNF